MRKTAEVELFGKKVTLSQRQAADVLDSFDAAQKVDGEAQELVLRVYILQQSLRVKYKYNRKYRAKYLLGHLTVENVIELSGKVLALENPESKKKAAVSPSVEKSQGQ